MVVLSLVAPAVFIAAVVVIFGLVNHSYGCVTCVAYSSVCFALIFENSSVQVYALWILGTLGCAAVLLAFFARLWLRCTLPSRKQVTYLSKSVLPRAMGTF